MALIVWPYGPERHYWMALFVLAYGMGGVAGWRWRTLYVAERRCRMALIVLAYGPDWRYRMALIGLPYGMSGVAGWHCLCDLVVLLYGPSGNAVWH